MNSAERYTALRDAAFREEPLLAVPRRLPELQRDAELDAPSRHARRHQGAQLAGLGADLDDVDGLGRLRVDLLVPSRDETYRSVPVPELRAHATSLPYLGFLLGERFETVV